MVVRRYASRVVSAVFFVGLFTSSQAAEELRGVSWPKTKAAEIQGGMIGASARLRAASDTLTFGSVDESGYAVQGEAWTWDHGGSDPLEGWDAIDVTAQTGTFFRSLDDGAWITGGGTGSAPVLAGNGSAWAGLLESEADAACWVAGAGYGNDWAQLLVSPSFSYTGSGTVDLSLTYFTDLEEDFDYARILLRRASGEDVPLNGDGFTGQDGVTGSNLPTGAPFSVSFGSAELAGSTSFRIVFEITSDGGWSDQDGSYATTYGGFAADEVTVSGSVAGGPFAYGYETDLEGWSPQVGDGVGALFGVAPVSSYEFEDCGCGLAGNVAHFHDASGEHPDGEHVIARSNPVDVLNDVNPLLGGEGSLLTIFAEWDQYSDMPRANGVHYRPGWEYYPYTCPVSGATQWSGRVGQLSHYYVGNDPVCAGNADGATTNGVPASGVEQIRFLFEVYASCDAFGIPPEICTGVTNETPLIDNVRIGFTKSKPAPAITFSTNTYYTDSFPSDGTANPTSTGPSDIGSNVNYHSEPIINGDSLYVSGPTSTTSTRWEARLWFRVARKGPAQNGIGAYTTWRDRVADGRDIENGEYTFAWMDSFQLGTQTARNKFVSYLRENDDDFDSGAGEFGAANEILPDNAFVPGTKIEYFVTANYTFSSEMFALPDTSGGHSLEFEILPNYVDDGGVWKMPSILYVSTAPTTFPSFRLPGLVTEAALNVALHGAAPDDPIPASPAWDRFDYPYVDYTSYFARGNHPQSKSGTTLAQMTGYRAVIWGGINRSHAFWGEDAQLMSDWLTSIYCDNGRQGIYMNGEGMDEAFLAHHLTFGIELGVVDGPGSGYRDLTEDPNACIRITDVGGSAFPPAVDYDAWGDPCSNQYGSYPSDPGVLTPYGSGIASRAYENVETGDLTGYQQVTNEVLGSGTGDYRSVVNAVSFEHLVTREPDDECTTTFSRIVEAAAGEIGGALDWFFDGAIPGRHAYQPCTPVDVESPSTTSHGAAAQLLGSHPNPFQPSTTIRFQLGAEERVELDIFDVQGRRIRTLIDEVRPQGLHEVVWDGTKEGGVRLASGVYWMQLRTPGYESSKRLVVLE